MNLRKLFANVFSNWTNLAISVLIAFLVSPILIDRLGDTLYGVWALIISVTGYFTVLDLGVNTAVIRFISRLEAAGDPREAQRVFSTSMALFLAIGATVSVLALACAPLFLRLIDETEYPSERILAVFAIIAVDVALGFLISVYIATLKAVNDFVRVNLVAIVARIAKNILIVWMLTEGYSLFTMGVIHFGETLFRLFAYWRIVRPRFRFRRDLCSRPLLGTLLNYSVYSLVISVATKAVFYTDSLLVTAMVGVEFVVYYAIPVALLLYLERLVYAMNSVVTPIVSSNEARADARANEAIYAFGTRYSLVPIVPVLTALWLYGGDFISIWIGPEKGAVSEPILQVLCLGYFAYASQIIANSVLKGISKHKVFAWILVAEAVANLALGIALGRTYGLIGIAWGATVALTVTNLLFVPLYACRVLGMSYARYMLRSYLPPLALAVPIVAAALWLDVTARTYAQFFAYCFTIGAYYLVVSGLFLMEPAHRRRLLRRFRRA